MLLKRIGAFNDDYRSRTITDVVAGYLDKMKIISEIQQFISTENRMDYSKESDYKEIFDKFRVAWDILNYLDISRPEINKALRKDIRNFLFSFAGILIGFGGLIYTILAYVK